MLPELAARMVVRERLVGTGHVKETAERVPALGDVEDQKPVGRDQLATALIVRAIGGDGAVPVGEILELCQKARL